MIPEPTQHKNRYRVAMVCSHAIQYLMPWYRRLAQHPRIALTVLLGDGHGLLAPGYDPGFGRAVRWDVPLLDGVVVERLRNHAPRPGVGRFSGIVSADVFSALSPRRFDAAVIQGWNYALYPLALLSARLNRLPVLLRGESPLLPQDAARGRLKHRLLSAYLSLCAGALAVSSGNRRLLRSYGMPEERIFLSPYAVDGDRFALPEAERSAARAALRKELRLSDEVPLLISVGKLQPVKDPGLFLWAYAALRKEGLPAALCFVGDGELRQGLIKDARDVPDVHFLGFKNQSELPAVYAAADLLVLPSRQETFGLVVNEAMHAGLPVICSDRVGCAEDLVRPGVTGLTFRQGDGDDLLSCLRALCTDGARRREMGQKARDRMRTWTFAESTAGLLDALDALVAR